MCSGGFSFIWDNRNDTPYIWTKIGIANASVEVNPEEYRFLVPIEFVL